MTDQRYDVIVVGARCAGSSLAMLMARKGHRVFITAGGITDAFLDAEGCAEGLDAALVGSTPHSEAMAGYQSRRDSRAMPMYQLTLQIAALRPPDEQMVQLVSAMAGNQDAMDAFARLNSGVTSPAEFFAPENVGRIMGAAS